MDERAHPLGPLRAALVSTDSSLHVVPECLGIRPPVPGIVPGKISFEFGQIPEKPEAIDHAMDHLLELGPLVSAKKSGEIGNVIIACTRYPLAKPAVVEIGAIAVPQFEHRQRTDDVAIQNADCDFRKIVKISDFGALYGSPDLLGDDFLEGEARNLISISEA